MGHSTSVSSPIAEARVGPDSNGVRSALRIGRSGRTNRVVRWVIGVAIIIGVATAILVFVMRDDRSSAVRWRTHVLERGDIRVAIDATGTLEPRGSVVVGAEISGRLATVEVEEDDRVVIGEVLARFERGDLELELAEAEASSAAAQADVKRARSALRSAERELKRARGLGGLVSTQELDNRTNDVELGTAELGRARAQAALAATRVARVQTKIDKSVVRAPIDGVVLRRAAEPGATVVSSLQAPELFTIARDLASMKLELAVDEADVGQVQAGQLAEFRVDAWPGRTFQAAVVRVRLAPSASGSVVTYLTEIDVDNTEGLLRPGMTATATLAVGDQLDVLRVPVEALGFTPPAESSGLQIGPPGAQQRHASGSSVWVLRGGELARIPITSGATDGAWIAVADDGGLAVGDELVLGQAPP